MCVRESEQQQLAKRRWYRTVFSYLEPYHHSASNRKYFKWPPSPSHTHLSREEKENEVEIKNIFIFNKYLYPPWEQESREVFTVNIYGRLVSVGGSRIDFAIRLKNIIKTFSLSLEFSKLALVSLHLIFHWAFASLALTNSYSLSRWLATFSWMNFPENEQMFTCSSTSCVHAPRCEGNWSGLNSQKNKIYILSSHSQLSLSLSLSQSSLSFSSPLYVISTKPYISSP